MSRATLDRWLTADFARLICLARSNPLACAVATLTAIVVVLAASPARDPLLRRACAVVPSDGVVAWVRGIPRSTVEVLRRTRSLDNAQICQLPDKRLARAISKAFQPRPDHPGEAVAFRNQQLQDEHGHILADGIVRASRHLKTMPVLQTFGSRTGNIPGARTAGINPAGWTAIGPHRIGGRVRALVFDPANGNNIWIGSVAGGIWSSTDGGANWTVVNDFMANLAVSTIVVNPAIPINLTSGSETGTLYAGTGEGLYNADGIRGAGIFKSVDAGKTWAQIATTNNSNFYYVNRLAVSADGTRILAATRTGLWVSGDAGSTWTRIIATNNPVASTSADLTDVDFAPGSSTVAIAGGYNGEVFSLSLNIGTGVWTIARAAGITSTADRVEVAYAPTDATVVYASVDINNGEIWKSTNGGASFAKVNTLAYNFLGNQGWYDNALWVDPTNANTLIVGGIDLWRSTDGGVSLTRISTWQYGGPLGSYASAHADHHVIVAHPGFNGTTNRMAYFGNDGGIYRNADVYTASSASSGNGWAAMNNNLSITQFYDASGHPGTLTIIGGTQDNGTLRYTPAGGTAGWTSPFGGDGGFSASDPVDSTVHYGEYVYLNVHRLTSASIYSDYISGSVGAGWKAAPYTIPDAQNYTANFIAPIALDPNNANRLLAGGQQLWRTNDAKTANTSTTGPSWYSIKTATGVTGYSGYISAIAVAQGNSDIVWVGYNNGDVYVTANGTATNPVWSRVDLNTPVLPNRAALRIAIDRNDSNTVYVSFGGYSTGNLWRTRDGGLTWANIHGNLPAAPVRALALHPNDSRWLYVGTEIGVFATENARDVATPSWGLPGADSPANVSVDSLFFLGTKLVAATHGRGLFTNDGLVPPAVTNLTPGNNATNIDTTVNLTWSASTGATAYDVYLGTSSTLTLAQKVSTVTVLSQPVISLVNGVQYFWRIGAVGTFGTAPGPVWSFTAGLPAVAGTPNPTDAATSISTTTSLNWAPSPGATSYDVYLGTTSSLGAGQLQGSVTSPGYIPSGLVDDTTYYWRIDARNGHGATTGPVWSFTTSAAGTGSGGGDTGSGGGGGCFIATAAYGTPMADEVRYLRAFRDQYLLTSRPGRLFVEFYYRHSPAVADSIRRAPALRAFVRLVLGPLVGLSRLLVSEESVQVQSVDRP